MIVGQLPIKAGSRDDPVAFRDFSQSSKHISHNQNFHNEMWQGMGNNGIVLVFPFIFENITNTISLEMMTG